MQDLRAELAGAMGEAEWEWLMPHASRDAVVVVKPDLDLLEVGVAIASDHTEIVQQWIEQSLLYKPNSEQIQAWASDRTRRFNALILQPYVLVQDIV